MDSIINFLLTEREVCTEKYRNEDFLRKDRARIGRGLYKKLRSAISLYIPSKRC
jgi:hypothetical protein